MRFEKLTQTIAAGAAWRLGMAAAELQIVSSSYPLRVTLYRGGAVIGSGSNVLAGDYFRGVDFDFVELFSDDAQDVTVLLSDGVSGSNRIVGEVSVINGELSRVKSGKAFIGNGVQSAVVAEYAHVQLLNPAGSLVDVVVNKISVMSASSAIEFVPRLYDTPLASLGVNASSKKLGAAAPVGQVRMASLAAQTGTGIMSLGVSSAYESKDIPFSEPFILEPGKGLLIATGSVNASLFTTFQWIEELR